jgi:hypothetical protein
MDSRSPAPPAKRSGRMCESLGVSPSTRGAAPNDRGASTEVARATGISVSSSAADLLRCHHRREAHRLGGRAPECSTAPGFDAPAIALLLLSTLSVGYTSASDGRPPMASVCQQKHLPAPSFRSRECPTLQASVRTPPRDVAATELIPADPTKQEARVPSKREQKPRSISHRSAVHSRLAPRGSEKIPSASAAWTRATTGNAGHRRGLSVPRACRHAHDVPACSLSSIGRPDKAGPRFGRAEAHPLRSPAQPGGLDETPTPTDTLQLQTGHDRSPTSRPTRRCCHHRPGRSDARGIGNALESTIRSTLGLRVAPGPLRRSPLRHAGAGRTGASGVQAPPSARDLPIASGRSTAGRTVPRGTSMSPPTQIPPGSSRLGDRGPTLPRADSGQSPSSIRFGARPPQRRCRRRTRLDCPDPWRQHELETSSRPRCPRSFRCSPRATPSPTRSSRPTPAGMPRSRIRLGSRTTLTALWKPPDATKHPHPGRPPRRAPTASARVPTRLERERRIIRPRRTFPERDAHGHATRFAPHKRSPND